MKLLRKVLFLGMVFTLGVTCIGWCDSIITVNFKKTDLSFSVRDGYSIIELKDCIICDDSGEPQLPCKVINLAIPAGTDIREVEIISKTSEVLPDKFNIYPTQPPFPMNEAPLPFVPQNSEIYDKDNNYPASLVETTGAGNLGSYTIGGLKVYPVQYNPAKKTLTFYSSITIRLMYTSPMNTTLSRRFADEAMIKAVKDNVKRLVTNKEDVDSLYSGPQPNVPLSTDLIVSRSQPGGGPAPTGGGVMPMGSPNETLKKYVIITQGQDMVDEFQRLADWHTKQGFLAEIKTVDWIIANCTGGDSPAKIRNYIRDCYENELTEYVLLAGDLNRVPCRGNWESWGPHEQERPIRSDLYYACLDGTWDANGNGIYGEPGDDVDFYPEVCVGRASVENASEARIFIDKVLTYEKNPPPDYLLNMLFMAAYLIPPGYPGYPEGIDMRPQKQSIADNYVPVTWALRQLYESGGTISRRAAGDSINGGCNIINHAGHGDWWNGINLKYADPQEYIMSEDADRFRNGTKYEIWYSYSCNSAAIDKDCFAERVLNNPNGGAVAYMGNTQVGYFPTSAYYDASFFELLFLSEHFRIGRVFEQSKIAYANIAQSNGVYRYIQFSLNLLGDPEMPVWTAIPRSLNVVHPGQISRTQTVFPVTVTSTNGPESNALVCIYKSGDVYGYGYTDENGQVTFSITVGLEGMMYVTVTGKNILPYEGEVLVARYIELSLSNPALNGSFAAVAQNTVSGTVAGDTADITDVAIEINGVENVTPMNLSTGAFSGGVTLNEGFNNIYIKLKDTQGAVVWTSSAITVYHYSALTGTVVPAGPDTAVASESASLFIPAGAFNNNVLISIVNNPVDNNINIANNKALNNKKLALTQELASTIVECNAFEEIGGNISCTQTVTGDFNNPVTLTILYPEGAASEKYENGLKIYCLDPVNLTWVLVPGNQSVNKFLRTVSTQINHFSIYRIVTSSLAAANLSSVRVYPNPFKLPVCTKVTFANLTSQTIIRIFTISGELVCTISENDGDGQAEWDGKNQQGQSVASGAYIFLATNTSGEKATGKIMVIR